MLNPSYANLKLISGGRKPVHIPYRPNVEYASLRDCFAVVRGTRRPSHVRVLELYIWSHRNDYSDMSALALSQDGELRSYGNELPVNVSQRKDAKKQDRISWSTVRP